MKKILGVILALAIPLAMIGCATTVESSDGFETSTRAVAATAASSVTGQSSDTATFVVATTPAEVVLDDAVNDVTEAPDLSAVTEITLGEAIQIAGDGATVDGKGVLISRGGVYRLTGALADGQIVVDAQDKTTVTLLLDGVSINNSDGAPLYVRQASLTELYLVEGSENVLMDGDTYQFEDAEAEEPNATLFSSDDLSIGGPGSLLVQANYHDAITSKDELTITGGVISVTAVGDGIRGKDKLTIAGGYVTVDAAGDGLESNNDKDADKGVISLEGGTVVVTAGGDAIEAESLFTMTGGQAQLVSGGGSVNGAAHAEGNWGRPGQGEAADETDEVSAKGIKASGTVEIADGVLIVDSADDAIHSNDSLLVSGGTLRLTSGDDGMHADAELTITGGDILITQSYEGIESAIIVIDGGRIEVTASDDGINVAGGNDGSSINGRPGQNTFAASGDRYLEINGGNIVVDATGDGLDVNGAITMTAGMVVISGPTTNGNGALDYDRGFQITGGTLIVAGSSGMVQAPDTSSSQFSLLVGLAQMVSGGTLIHIETEDGETLLTYAPVKDYQTLVFSSPELRNGTTYAVYTGGSASGTVVGGLYSDGTYSDGTLLGTTSLSSVVTTLGSVRGGMGGGGGQRPTRK